MNTNLYHPGPKPAVVNLVRFVWAEATRTIYGRLRFGLHPGHLAQMFHDGYVRGSELGDDYIMASHSLANAMLTNLENKMVFRHLPPFEQYLATIYYDPLKKMAFEIAMYHRFENEFTLMWAYMDEFMYETLVTADPLNESEVQWLRSAELVIRREVEDHYQGKFSSQNMRLLTQYEEQEERELAEDPRRRATLFIQGYEMDPFGPRERWSSWEGPGAWPESYTKPPPLPDLVPTPSPRTARVASPAGGIKAREEIEAGTAAETAQGLRNAAHHHPAVGADLIPQRSVAPLPFPPPVTPKNKTLYPPLAAELPSREFRNRPFSHNASPKRRRRPPPRSRPSIKVPVDPQPRPERDERDHYESDFGGWSGLALWWSWTCDRF
ncbi:uncharacterized protein L3040_005127 [Drepanopeziza brunnea f. sp. 'multigermtubi']|uniref:uncharacterized protein n=1 Tax=Drepanopeziza brunnea f. sp. 'multigermtubi' TaxID=698441 RepID=UPI00238D822E|nr:hypothetical protein L3040_005127 [Drepanopeziza brunnea f. sp. 'multigermtubi']